MGATIVAALVAAVLLATVVLPAEHGIDPTGVGRLLGLKKMGEIKVALDKEVSADAGAEASTSAGHPAAPTSSKSQDIAATTGPAPPTAATATPSGSGTPASLSHVTEVVLAPGEGKEIKLVMRRGASVTYSWSTDMGAVNYDRHADAPGVKYHGYGKGFGKSADEGVLVAAFDGAHGWFWRNRGEETIRVTVRTQGEYEELKR